MDPIKIFLSQPEKYIKQYILIADTKSNHRDKFNSKTIDEKINTFLPFQITDAFLYYFSSCLAKPNIKTELQLLYFEGTKYTHHAIIYKDCALIMLGRTLIYHRFTKKYYDRVKIVSKYITDFYCNYNDTLSLKNITYYHLDSEDNIENKLFDIVNLLIT